MVKAGLPILQTLAMLRDQLESPAIKEVIEDIRKSLEGGVTLSKCFEKYPQYFDNVYVNLIKAGEASGKLDVFLLKIVDDLEKKEKIKKSDDKNQNLPSFFKNAKIKKTIEISENIALWWSINGVPTEG